MRALIIAAVLVTTGGAAAAQTFTYAKPEDVPEVPAADWAGSAEAGFLFTTGNSRTTIVTAGGKIIRLAKQNKVQAEAGLAFAQSSVLVGVDFDMSGDLSEDEISKETLTTANTWFGKLRYDRFLTTHNSLYAAALISRDVPAGKELSGGGQVGYSRQIYKTAQHEVVGEVGYDLTFEDPSAPPEAGVITIHSLRLFTGYIGTLSPDTGVTASIESLSNLNTLAAVDPMAAEPDEATAFEDTRISANAGITTKLSKSVSFSFSIGVKYDNQPAPRAAFAIPYEPGFVPLSSKVDTLTKASLIVALF